MSEHKATIHWRRETADFAYETYNRDHNWQFDGGITVRASAAPAYLGNIACVDPEEAFVASLSSCHMLTFLSMAARKHLTVDEYQDEASGVLAKDAEGRLAITAVTLRPRITFSGKTAPTADEISALHDKAHHACFIANSVKTQVTVQPPY
jgi:organic hydroperoxide reductase OsmC/OhrA